MYEIFSKFYFAKFRILTTKEHIRKQKVISNKKGALSKNVNTPFIHFEILL